MDVRTEKLFASSLLLNDLDQARFQLFDRRDMLSENTHFSRFGGKIDLDTEGSMLA